MVADAFGSLIEGAFAGAFAEVVFAVHERPGRPNHAAFVARFAPGAA